MSTEKPVRLERTTVFSNNHATFHNDLVEWPNGIIATHLKIERPNGTNTPGACILPILENGDIVLAKEYFYGADDYLLVAPQGTTAPTETPEQAAARELREETGCIVSNKKCDLIPCGSIKNSPRITAATTNLYIALNCKRTHIQKLDPTELISIKIVRKKELEHLFNSGQITDANSYALIAKYLYDYDRITAERDNRARIEEELANLLPNKTKEPETNERS